MNQVPWEVVIFDEAHRLKSTSSQTSKAAKEIKTKCRYGLTGTVMQNSLDELWNLIDWCSPNLLGSLEQMRNTYHISLLSFFFYQISLLYLCEQLHSTNQMGSKSRCHSSRNSSRKKSLPPSIYKGKSAFNSRSNSVCLTRK